MNKSKVIYLDQNIISNITNILINKASMANNENILLFKEIYQILKNKFNNKKLFCPYSWIHSYETQKRKHKLYDNAESCTYDIQDKLTDKSFLNSLEIENMQFAYYASQYFELNYNPFKEDYSVFINSSYDNHHNRIHIPPDTKSLNTLRQTGKYTKKFHLENEFNATRNEYLQNLKPRKSLYTTYIYLRYNKISDEEIKEYIKSDDFIQIPRIDIFCNLWNAVLTNKDRKTTLDNDFFDIEMISTYMPYCDALVTDTFMANLIKQYKFDKKYNCNIFSVKKSSLLEFKDFINNI